MRPISLPLLFTLFLLSACAPQVTLLRPNPSATPQATPTLAPSPSPLPSPTPAPSLGIDPAALDGVQISLWHGLDGSTAALLAQLTTEFNLTNLWGITVNLQASPNLNQMETALQKDSAQYDALLLLPEQALSRQEELKDLGIYLHHPEFGIPTDQIPVFFQQSAQAEAQWGVPFLRSARVLAYNQTWARELGFSAAPQTWQEFRQQACAANASWKTDADQSNDGFGGLLLENTSNWQTPYGWVTAQGGQVLEGEDFRFGAEENAAALQNLFSLREDGCAWFLDSFSGEEQFAARRALFLSISLPQRQSITQAMGALASADEWTLIAFPGDSPAVPVYGLDFALHRGSEAKQLAAWLFVRWMLEPEQQARLAQETGLLPVRESVLRAKVPSFAALLPFAVLYPQTADWAIASQVFGDGYLAMARIFPYASAQGVLDEVDSTVLDLTKEKE